MGGLQLGISLYKADDNIEVSGIRDNPIKKAAIVTKSHVKQLDILLYQEKLNQFQYI